MNWKTVGLWIIRILLAAMFVMAGSGKLINPAQFGTAFVNWGYPAWFATVIGAVEVVGGILLLVQRAAFYAAGTLAAVMAGAAFTHLKTTGEAPRAAVPIVLLILSVLVALARRPKA